MSSLPSHILLHGDKYLAKNTILKAKNKFPQYTYVTYSMATSSLDDLRAEIGTYDWMEVEKVFIIEGIANNKAAREFILDIARNTPAHVKLLIWDSLNHIKPNSKTGKLPATWKSFLKDFEKIDGHKVINHGEKYTEKNEPDTVVFVQQCFKKYGKEIGHKESKLLIDIVGRERGLLSSDIDKMSLTAPSHITPEFILDNAYPMTQAAVLYHFSNVLDSGSYAKASRAIEEFMYAKINANVLAEIMMKKARWQLVVANYFAKKMPWDKITDSLMDMGQFPSYIWHNPNKTTGEKKKLSEPYQGAEGMKTFLHKKQGIPERYFKVKVVKKKILKSGKVSKAKGPTPKAKTERIPMRFMAAQTVSFVKDKIVRQNGNCQNIHQATLERATKVYLAVYERLVDVRCETNQMQYLKDMARMLTSTKL